MWRATMCADSLKIELADSKSGVIRSAEMPNWERGKWAAGLARFAGVPSGAEADEIRLGLPKGAEILVDDLLLYEPSND